MNAQILSILAMIVGVVLVLLILLQSKGTGLGSTFGGDMGFYGTKRGAEKMLFILTIIVAILFFIVSLINVMI